MESASEDRRPLPAAVVDGRAVRLEALKQAREWWPDLNVVETIVAAETILAFLAPPVVVLEEPPTQRRARSGAGNSAWWTEERRAAQGARMRRQRAAGMMLRGGGAAAPQEGAKKNPSLTDEIRTAAQGPGAAPRRVSGADERAAAVDVPPATRTPEKVPAEGEAASPQPSSGGGPIPGAGAPFKGGPLPPSPVDPRRAAEIEAQAAFVAQNGVTRGAPAFAVPSEQGALHGAAAAEKINDLDLDETGRPRRLGESRGQRFRRIGRAGA